jgi:hypothetical protein
MRLIEMLVRHLKSIERGVAFSHLPAWKTEAKPPLFLIKTGRASTQEYG